MPYDLPRLSKLSPNPSLNARNGLVQRHDLYSV
jgi:hypothetical protein